MSNIIMRKPDVESDHSEEDAGLHACAQDIIDSIESKDQRRLAGALRAVFELLESEPHEEEGEQSDDQYQNESQGE